MPGDRSHEYRRLAALCLALARQAADPVTRGSLIEMAQKWLDLSELAAHDVWTRSLQHRAIQAAIGDRLKALYELPYLMPPHFLALLSQLDAEGANEE